VKGLLVAVGLGERMTRPAWHSPRLLGPTLESPPVDQVIEAFARAGFEEVAVIVGHSEDVLWHYLEDGSRYGMAVYCLHNSQYRRGTATAIYAARAFVGGEPFVVSLSGQRLAHWDAVSTGAFLFQPDVFKYISELLLHGKGDCSISALLRKMIACGEMPYACDVSPRWKGVLGSEDMLVWTAPMLSVRAVPEPLLA
jgi:dTDP-glucose pyrophosphorylase